MFEKENKTQQETCLLPHPPTYTTLQIAYPLLWEKTKESLTRINPNTLESWVQITNVNSLFLIKMRLSVRWPQVQNCPFLSAFKCFWAFLSIFLSIFQELPSPTPARRTSWGYGAQGTTGGVPPHLLTSGNWACLDNPAKKILARQ